MKIFLLFGVFCFLVTAQRSEDLVTSLPGFTHLHLPNNMYSGFINISKNKHLHYLYMESESQPDNDPIIVWFNGGPGGTSINCFFRGIGPIDTDDMITFRSSQYAWTRNASILMIDNPAGVGYSYAKRDIDFNQNDYSQQRDALNFMMQFYKHWPQRVKNPLYFFGVSYGGMYAPYLALAIHHHNQEVAMN